MRIDPFCLRFLTSAVLVLMQIPYNAHAFSMVWEEFGQKVSSSWDYNSTLRQPVRLSHSSTLDSVYWTITDDMAKAWENEPNSLFSYQDGSINSAAAICSVNESDGINCVTMASFRGVGGSAILGKAKLRAKNDPGCPQCPALIYDADISIQSQASLTFTMNECDNSVDPDGCDINRVKWSPDTTIGTDEWSFHSVILHELGHLVGCGHSDQTPSIMEAKFGTAKTATTTLHPDDAACVQFLYGKCGDGTVTSGLGKLDFGYAASPPPPHYESVAIVEECDNGGVCYYNTNHPDDSQWYRPIIPRTTCSTANLGACPGGAYCSKEASAVCDAMCRIPEPECGNGILEFPSELCDQGPNNGTSGSCCTSNCSFKSTGTVCRPSQGPCDIQETCNGGDESCGFDIKRPSGYECRPVAGLCDPSAEVCNGSAVTCPADNLMAVGTVCRASSAPCDLAETCPGTSGNCPNDSWAGAGASCSDGNDCTDDQCNAAGSCVGTNDNANTVTCTDSCYGTPGTQSCWNGSLQSCIPNVQLCGDGIKQGCEDCDGAAGSCGIAQKCAFCQCVSSCSAATAASLAPDPSVFDGPLDGLRKVREEVFRGTATGDEIIQVIEKHEAEINQILADNPVLLAEVQDLILEFGTLAERFFAGDVGATDFFLGKELQDRLDNALHEIYKVASPELEHDLKHARNATKDLFFKSLKDAVFAINGNYGKKDAK